MWFSRLRLRQIHLRIRSAGFWLLSNDNDYGDTTATPAAVTNIKTGGNIAVAMVAELDRKVDDGLPGQGIFRIGINYGGVNPALGACLTGATNGNPGMLTMRPSMLSPAVASRFSSK